MKARKSNTGRTPYLILNRVFLVILLLVMLYALVFSPEKQRHLIPSGSLLFSDNHVISTGLSRSFSASVRLDFAAAKNYNPFGIRIFLFFFIQLLMRTAGMFAALRVPDKGLLVLYWSDSLISVILFLISFGPFLSEIIDVVSNP